MVSRDRDIKEEKKRRSKKKIYFNQSIYMLDKRNLILTSYIQTIVSGGRGSDGRTYSVQSVHENTHSWLTCVD